MPAKKRQPTRLIVTAQSIAERAYAKWQARGCPSSDGLEDWFAAQTELELERIKHAPRIAKTAMA